MEYVWLNNREPNDEGFYEVEIRNSAGNRVSSFRARTESEMIDQLLTSQVHANREIGRLRKPDAARPALHVEPKTLSDADRLRLSTEITDPNRVVEAVDEIVTARMGIAPDKLGADFARKSREEQDAYYGQEAEAFKQEHPEFYPVPQNRDAVFEVLKANRWDLTRNNLALAFNTLLEAGKMIPWPSDEDVADENEANPQPVYINGNGRTNGQTATPPANSPRPRTIATTGLRNSDVSGTPPPPQPRKQKYTRADIERMSRTEYSDKIRSDPDFRRQVDAMG